MTIHEEPAAGAVTKAQVRAAVLDRLGLTEDEVALLFTR